MTEIDDHILLLMGVSDGYPLPEQHPANDLLEGSRFDAALDEAAKHGTLVVERTSHKLVLTEAGRSLLEKHGMTVSTGSIGGPK